MTNHNASWRKRRWNIFLRAYLEDTEFRSDFDAINIRTRNGEIIEDEQSEALGDLLREYGVPLECWQACQLYSVDSKLPEKSYLERIMPPLLFWHAGTDKLGPHTGSLPASELFRWRLEGARDQGELSFDLSNIDYQELAKALTENSPMVEIRAHVTKEEVKEVITEYWPEISKMIEAHPSKPGPYGSQIEGKVQPTRTRRLVERNELVAKWTNEGVSVGDIIARLVIQGYGNERTLTPENVRQIRSRLRRQGKIHLY